MYQREPEFEEGTAIVINKLKLTAGKKDIYLFDLCSWYLLLLNWPMNNSLDCISKATVNSILVAELPVGIIDYAMVFECPLMSEVLQEGQLFNLS